MESTPNVTLNGLSYASCRIASSARLPQITTQHIPPSPTYTPMIHSTPPEQSSLQSRVRDNDDTQGSIPELTSASSKDSIYSDKQVYNSASPAELRPDITPVFNSTSLLEPFNSPTERENMPRSYSDTNVLLEQAVGTQGLAMSHESQHVERELPPPVLNLPYSICKKRMKLDQEKPGKLGRFKNRVTGKEDRKADPGLKDISSDHRELVSGLTIFQTVVANPKKVFIIDNGWTMFEHWPILTFVVETLAMNAAGIDESGIDLRFTVDGNSHKKDNIVGDRGRRTLRNILKKARPECKQQANVTTNMIAVFEKVYQEWESKKEPATTLYVFTDGKWAKENLTDLSQSILKFAKQDRRGTGNRHFSIQLIRFGDDETDKKQLQWLDDNLCSDLNLRDIIDHCSWRADVDKIFKGSIDPSHDQNDDGELPIEYNYQELVKKFDRFNTGDKIQESGGKSAGLLSPSTPSLLHRSSSQNSGRSTSTLRKRDTTPPETPRSHSKRTSWLSP